MSGEAPTLRRVHAFVSGRVQGVWFRESTRSECEALGVGGWVRNLPDGRVEVELIGERDAVARALRFLHSGPELARVDDVEVASDDLTRDDGGSRFRIR